MSCPRRSAAPKRTPRRNRRKSTLYQNLATQSRHLKAQIQGLQSAANTPTFRVFSARQHAYTILPPERATSVLNPAADLQTSNAPAAPLHKRPQTNPRNSKPPNINATSLSLSLSPKNTQRDSLTNRRKPPLATPRPRAWPLQCLLQFCTHLSPLWPPPSQNSATSSTPRNSLELQNNLLPTNTTSRSSSNSSS
ncbi:hypothetical protein KC19_10G066800 [Ceratodon purpureus]|uniref:Uncharacterized protein n=1 Tax=Ceratodon purpureus TaxID=3225 RepID=A0A8T0GIZ6_CERPU|nr:hypothetical protein KC19_10G066800 [Ceratodon purpureus]